MIRRLALTAGCIALSTIALSGKAHAQTVDINFTGTVPPSCSTSSVTAGVMKVPTGNLPVLTSTAADAAGASNGSFKLTCTGAAQVSIGIPTPQNAASGNVGNYGSRIEGVTSNYAVKGGAAQTGTIAAPISNRTVEVNTFVNNGGTPLPVGTYAYKATVTITPQ